MSAEKPLICVHGFWSHGVGMMLVKRHLEREYEYACHLFSYPSVSGSLDENAALFRDYLIDNDLEDCHIVGHSLGGVVALRMLSTLDVNFSGRLVCLGSPLCGSRAAEFLSRQDWAGGILGRSLPEGTVESRANDWAREACERHEIGVIAGSIPIGIGRLTGMFDEASDGTVAVSETQIDGASDHITLPVSHMGMLVSRQVADQAGAFIKRGQFLREQ